MQTKRYYTRTLTKLVSQQTGLSYSKIDLVLKALVEVVSSLLAAGNEVIITNLGRFKVTQLKPRQIKDVQTGALFDIGSTSVVRFKAANRLKHSL